MGSDFGHEVHELSDPPLVIGGRGAAFNRPCLAIPPRTPSLCIDFDPVASKTPSVGFRLSEDTRCMPQTRLASEIGPLSLNDEIPEQSSLSMMTLIRAMGGNPTTRSILKSADLASFKHEVVKYLPVEYDGDYIFKLHALSIVKEEGVCQLGGMDPHRDGHTWTETKTTNISNPSGKLLFKYVRCMGHLRCTNPDCRCLIETKAHTEIY